MFYINLKNLTLTLTLKFRDLSGVPVPAATCSDANGATASRHLATGQTEAHARTTFAPTTQEAIENGGGRWLFTQERVTGRHRSNRYCNGD